VNKARPRSPSIFVLSGPSGVGKDSVIDKLQGVVPRLHVVVTVTTRSMRPGEENGRSYFFVTEEEFLHRNGLGDLVAVATVHGHWYGAPVSDIESALSSGHDVLLKVDVQGAAQLRTQLTGAVYVFLAPTSLQSLQRRLTRRQTESAVERDRRLRDAEREMEQVSFYDYCVVNAAGRLETSVCEVAAIITAERLRVHHERATVSVR